MNYDYDLANEVTAIRENGATSGIGVLATYAYDDRGRRTGIAYGNGAGTSYGYDAVDRLTSLTQDLASTGNDLTLGFSYNPAGGIASTTRSNDAYAWTDHYGVTRTYTPDGLNRYSSIATAGGSTISPSYDSRGNLTAAGGATYTYSSENLLTAATGGVTLAYDPGTRLYQTSNGVNTTRFAYDGDNMIAEYDGSNSLQRRYVFGPGGEPLVWYEGSGTSTRRWFHNDERGSVVAVSDSAGAAFSRNAYDEYGIPASTNTARFGYTGQAWLPELGMAYYRARIYSPTLGRFMQTDPIGFGGGMNLYGYVMGDPVNFIDPSGLGPNDPPCDDCTGPPIVITATRAGPGGAIRFGSGRGAQPRRVRDNGDGGGSTSSLIQTPQSAREQDCRAIQIGIEMTDEIGLTGIFNAPNIETVIRRIGTKAAPDLIPGVGEALAAVQVSATVLNIILRGAKFAEGCQ